MSQLSGFPWIEILKFYVIEPGPPVVNVVKSGSIVNFTNLEIRYGNKADEWGKLGHTGEVNVINCWRNGVQAGLDNAKKA